MMLLFFLLSPAEALDASRRGLMLWFTQLLPTLLPFTVLSYVVLRSGIFDSAKGQGAREWYVIVCGFLFGFPIGSKLTADLYGQGKLTREAASVLFIFTNNLSPVFVTSVFQEQLNRRPGAVSYLLLYGIPFTYGMMSLFLRGRRARGGASADGHKNTASRFELDMQIIDAGIINGFETLIKICGYIMMFSLTAELIKNLPFVSAGVQTLLIGIVEVTNGMSALSGLVCPGGTKYLLAMLFLSLGGISGMFQTASIVSRTDLSMGKYLVNRLLLTAFTVLAAALCLTAGVLDQ